MSVLVSVLLSLLNLLFSLFFGVVQFDVLVKLTCFVHFVVSNFLLLEGELGSCLLLTTLDRIRVEYLNRNVFK